MLGEERGGYVLEFGVPFGTEAGYEGLSQELVDGKAELTPQGESTAADIPMVDVDSDEPVCEGLEAQGVEAARDGFGYADGAFAEGDIDGAKADAVAVADGKDAVATVDGVDGELARGIDVGDVARLDDAACRGAEERHDCGENAPEE